MIGIVISCHKEMSENLLDTASSIMGYKPGNVVTFSAQIGIDIEELKLGLLQAIAKVESGDGVLVLTDIIGGTPSSLADDLRQRKRIEVVTGVNLPMVIASLNYREQMDLKRLSIMVATVGKESIFLLRDSK